MTASSMQPKCANAIALLDMVTPAPTAATAPTPSWPGVCEGQLRLDRPVSIGGMEIGMADTGIGYLDENAGMTSGYLTSSICNSLPKAWARAAFITLAI